MQKAVVGVGVRPAPETPLAASTMIPFRSSSPASISGASASVAAVDVAPWRGDQAGALQLVAMPLRQPVHGLGQQLGLIVGEAVPLWVRGGVLQAERRREVHDAADVVDQLRRGGQAGGVREAQEDDVETVQPLRVEGLEHKAWVRRAERRVQRLDRRTGLGITRGERQLDVRVSGQQP